jgi:hypothetical protein
MKPEFTLIRKNMNLHTAMQKNQFIKALNYQILKAFLLCLCSCGASKKNSTIPNTIPKQLTIIYKEVPRSFPLKNFTEFIKPAIYLPVQQKAFELDRTQTREPKTLVLQFSPDDDSSIVQIMANSPNSKFWITTDTLIKVSELTQLNTCLTIHLNTYKVNDFRRVPQLTLLHFECSDDEINPDTFRGRFLKYNVSSGTFKGNNRRIFRKKGYDALFRNPFFPNRKIIKASDIE